MRSDKAMIQGTESARPPQVESRHATPQRDPRTASNAGSAERFGQALNSASRKFGSERDASRESGETREPENAQAGMRDAMQRSPAPKEATKDSGIVAVSGFSAQGDRALVQTQGPQTGSAAFAGSVDAGTLQRLAAALETPLAGLQSGAHSTFTVSVSGTAGPLSAQVQMGADGRLTVALALPGLSAPHKEALARDLRRHLTNKGFADNLVRLEETVAHQEQR
ncbi:hypothetical protein [Qipengyuania qiaonensis]|uniref:Flagellar hook-length control protein FliK n=1 Tax=Qipengyuania qiaonensis TaxID=2867240 RepID=A0ABS7J608_9SPHN|nr:hypothetical protein [Qipengyuania qiaonensis]MBX7482747.1 hypothetical protein [Qipengyuania qiaonensis]